MRLKIIGCEVLAREIYYCAAKSKNIIDIELLPRGLHDNPDTMRSELQRRIDTLGDGKLVHVYQSASRIYTGHQAIEKSPDHYSALLIAYGLCSQGTDNLIARGVPLVIPRAHDCITFFLGSKERYLSHFNSCPGTYYYCVDWIERMDTHAERSVASGQGLGKTYEEYVAKYGEENARYLLEIEQSWSKRYSKATFIDMEIIEIPRYREQVKEVARLNNWRYEEVKGSLDLVQKLLDGEWNEENFVVVKPGERSMATNDTRILGTGKLLTK